VKLKDGWSKWMLREVMKGAMPEEVRLRKTKLGFDVPQTRWMREGLSNGHRHLWDTPQLRMARFLDAGKLAQETRRFLNGESGGLPTDPLFRAISLEHWARVHSVS
jgi:asparagine synthase (glutamine-hydrolysing)